MRPNLSYSANLSKGAVDSLGDLVKNSVFRHVLSKKVVIKSSKHFAEYANSILPNISVIFVDNNDDCKLNFHEECTEKAAYYIYGTLQVHFAERLSALMKICQIPHVIFQATSQFFFKLCISSVSWKIIPLYFFSSSNIYFAQTGPIKVKIFETFECSGQNLSNS